MSGFQVGDTVVGNPSTESAIITTEIKEQLAKENQMMQEVKDLTIERTPEQEAAIAEVKNAIDLTKGDLVISYGQSDLSKVNTLADRTLNNIRAVDIGDIGDMLTGLATQLSIKDIQDPPKKGIFGLFSKAKDKMTQLQIHYESVDKNIDRIIGSLENNQLSLIKNNKDIVDALDLNKEQYQRLSVFVEAGRQRIKEAYEKELPELEENAKSGNFDAINTLTAYKNGLSLFEKQVHDLDVQMTLAITTQIQLQTISNNNVTLIQKINRTKENMVHSWKLAMIAAFQNEQTKKALEADKAAVQTHKEILEFVSTQIRTTAVETAIHGETATVGVETIQKIADDVVFMLQDIDKAQKQGAQNRQNAAKQINDIRENVKSQLLTTIQNANDAYTS